MSLLHPGPTLPFWARITYLSPPLLLQPGKRKSHFSEFTTPNPPSASSIPSHKDDYGRKNSHPSQELSSPDLEPHVGVSWRLHSSFEPLLLHLWWEMWARAYSNLWFRSCFVGFDLIWILKKDPILLSILIHAKVRWCDWDVKLLSQAKDFLTYCFGSADQIHFRLHITRTLFWWFCFLWLCKSKNSDSNEVFRT